jgi:dTDP-6-deoxy-L-talose 4-dehydrogenase (NAD+)
MKILLTGPTGFIGKAFIRLALNQGHQIAGLVIPAETIPADLPASPDLVWLRGTLEEAPWQEIGTFAPDVCLHTAWVTTPGVYLESPDNYRFLEASVLFLKRARELGVNYFLTLGTCVEYQITNQPLVEDRTPIVPTSTYARCKNELRQTIEADAKAGGFTCCWGRVFYPYGPGEHPSRLCSSIIQKLARDEKLVLKTPNSTKDYIFIEDLAAAILTVLNQRATGAINLGTGIGLSVREIAHAIGKLIGKPHLIEEVNPPAEDPLGYVVADASKLHALGWQPLVNLSGGVARLGESLLKKG